MTKIVMVSKIVMEFNEDTIMDMDTKEAIKNGELVISIPEMSLLDEEGNDLMEDGEGNEIAKYIMDAFKEVEGA